MAVCRKGKQLLACRRTGNLAGPAVVLAPPRRFKEEKMGFKLIHLLFPVIHRNREKLTFGSVALKCKIVHYGGYSYVL